MTHHPVDIHVGKRLRQARWRAGKSQADIARNAGISHQQVQKFESGANRIKASQLFVAAGVLNVNVEYFFEGLDCEKAITDVMACNPELFENREAFDLVRAYYRMPKLQRTRFWNLVKALAN